MKLLFVIILNSIQMKETVKQRLVRFIKYKGLGQSKFEKLVGLSNGYISNLKSNPSPEKIMNIFGVFPELNRSWLLTGEGEMLNGDKPVAMTQGEDGIPFYEHSIACGSPDDFNACIEANKADGHIMLPRLTGDFALVARGESMIDAQHPDRSIAPGSIVVLRKMDDGAFLRWGEIYAIATADGFIIKKIMPLDDDHIECRSLNSAEFPPFPMLKQDIYGFARVIAVISYKLY